MARGKRKFIVEITETLPLTAGELESALSRLAGRLHNGTASIESGDVLNSRNSVIGTYRWEPQEQAGPETEVVNRQRAQRRSTS